MERKWIEIHSQYSGNIIYDFSMEFSEIQLQKLENQLQFYYEGNFDNILLSHDKQELIRNFTYQSGERSTMWNYQMHDSAQDSSFHISSYYLIEVRENHSDMFQFHVLTGMNNGKHEIKRGHYITCYL